MFQSLSRMLTPKNLSQKGLLLVSLTLTIELLFVGVLAWQKHQTDASLEAEMHARLTMSKLTTLTTLMQDTMLKLIARNMSTTSTNQWSVMSAFKKSVDNINAEIDGLQILLREYPQELSSLQEFKHSLTVALSLVNEILHTDIQDRITQLNYEYKLLGVTMSAVQQSKLLSEKYRDVTNFLPQERIKNQQVFDTSLLIGALINVVTACVAMQFFSVGITKRVKVLIDNSARLASGLSLNPKVGGRDEISKLDDSFHSMAKVITEAAEKERAIIDNASDVICSIDKAGRFTRVSAAAQTVWKISPDSLIGARAIHSIPDQQKEDVSNHISEVCQNLGISQFESKLMRGDEVVIDVLWNTQWSKSENALFCVIHDITERKRAEDLIKENENRIRTIFNHLPIGVLLVGLNGDLKYANPKASRLFESFEDSLIGNSCSEFLSIPADLMREIATAQPFDNRAEELSGVTRSKRQFPVECTASKFITASGDLQTLLCLQDISERRDLEQRKQEFVSMVSHDLRTPLSSVKATLTMFSEGVWDSKTDVGRERLDVADRTLNRLMELINDLLDIERMESGRMPLDLTEVSAKEIVESALSEVKIQAASKRITLQSNCDSCLLIGDFERLIQVMINLIGNAIKFAPQDSVITAAAFERGDDIEFEVTDQGRGIPEEMQAAVFDKYRQVETADGKKGLGKGLGLPICKTIVESHKGLIGVRSELNQGTTFWFRIPKDMQA
ncbi:hypothetical protein BH10CYA1_BH10CYA1_43540 [soil metagenome]